MTNRVQSRRSNTTTQNFANAILSGELAVNQADLQLYAGSADATPIPDALLAVQNFATTATYPANSIVAYGGALYVAKATVTPGAFTPSNWNQITNHPIPADAAGSLTNNGTGTLSWTPMLPLAGGTVSGPIIAAADPVAPLGLATKQYADAINTSLTASIALKAALAGATFTGPVVLSGAPTTALQAATKGYADLMVPLAGGTMTGALLLNTAPTTALQAATKGYADLMVPLAGGTMTGPLVLPGAPTSALQAATKGYADALPGASAPFRNYIQNGQFNVLQRTVAPASLQPWTTQQFGIDRWQFLTGTAGGTRSYTQSAITDAERTTLGDESAVYALNAVIAGGSGAGDLDVLQQAIENLHQFAGKTVTISFYAAAATGTPKLGVNLLSYFGSGGSPSANVNSAPTSVTLGTAFARYSVSIAVPTAIGKTFGTNNDSYLALQLAFSAGATNNATYGSPGVQTDTFRIWGVQLEIGTQVSALEKRPYATELAMCQRYFQLGDWGIEGYGAAGVQNVTFMNLPTVMRATPTLGYSVTFNSGVTTGAPSANGARSIGNSAELTTAAGYYVGGIYTLSAEI